MPMLISKISFFSLFKKPSLVFNTLSGDREKSQKKLLNYLLFGSLGYQLIENMVKEHKKENSQLKLDVNQQKTSKKHSLVSNKEIAKSVENLNSSQIVSKEISLDDLLFELIQETNKVTISQVIVQFLKINSKLDKSTLVLSIVVSIVNSKIFINFL